METSETYFHLLEITKTGKIARVDYYYSLEDAEKEQTTQQELFPDLKFEIHPTDSKDEPDICNC